MTKRDPVTGLTDAELAKLADESYEQRDNSAAWADEDAPEIGPDVRSVVSVRFSKGELGPIERAATAAGIPISTFIRNAAINAVSAVDINAAHKSVEALREDLENLVTALGARAGGKSKRDGKPRTKRAVA